MTKIDQFESVFKAATRTLYKHDTPSIKKVMLLTDLKDEYENKMFVQQIHEFLDVLGKDTEWINITGEDYRTIEALLEAVETHRPDLICTYRHVYSDGWKWNFTLGEHLMVLTQTTPTPILVLPRPDKEAPEHALKNTDRVMAITDHLTGDDHLIHYAVHFTQNDGKLFLTHIEDEGVFERYMQTTEKIPEIDSTTARQTIKHQLLKEPHDYITSCRSVLQEQQLPIQLEEIITMGNQLERYKALIDKHEIDLLVLNTKDDDQLAMHGLAYPLAVELRDIPLLML
ncbi:MAG TPA: hypothetical protein DCE42_07420 [Myxococcales bacterium]|nr:hypothetical protein [Deltaproteobacteria bacterium]HAA54570.1 hypothetical protein [Myxococcales bacterium]|tara:strand:- start:19738 stop:20592 length:855 start_codon:yes stop_codon:yes gene_type:complete